MSPSRAGAISPFLALIVEALELRQNKDRPKEAAALRALGELALSQVITRGVLAPTEDQLYNMIDRIATAHLGLGDS